MFNKEEHYDDAKFMKKESGVELNERNVLVSKDIYNLECRFCDKSINDRKQIF